MHKITGFPGGSVVKNPSANAGDVGLIPGLGPGGGIGNPLQYSCLEIPMDRGTSWAAINGGHKELDTNKHSIAQNKSRQSTDAHRPNSELWRLDAEMLSQVPVLGKERDSAALLLRIHAAYKNKQTKRKRAINNVVAFCFYS